MDINCAHQADRWLLTIMNEESGHQLESFPDLCDSMDNDGLSLKSGDFGYEIPYYFPPELANMADFAYPSKPIDFFGSGPFSDTSYDQNAPYLSSGNTSTTQRQQPTQQLRINTQLTFCQTSDPESSTTSGTSFGALETPSFRPCSGFQPAIYTSSPQSASTDGGRLMPDFSEKRSPLPPSPLSVLPFGLEGAIFDQPTSPTLAEVDVVTQITLPHVLAWRKVIEQCGTNDFVDQKVYQPPTEADKKRYIQDVELKETIFFHADSSSELGISLDDALRQRLRHLKDKSDRMFMDCGPSVSIRIQWPGYAPWSKQIPTLDFRTPRGHITRAKLAKNIATCLRRFVEAMQDKPMEAESDTRWKVGRRHITAEDLILVSLHHVSKGSWQPQLRLRSRNTTFSCQSDQSFMSVPAS